MTDEVVIGLEFHAQLRTRAKLFCRCPTGGQGPPNTRVCPVCLGHPGVLPVVNRAAVELALRAAVALEAQIAPSCGWARKNYFYPDLPKGYQITQYDHPLAWGGKVGIECGGIPGTVPLERIHLEEDAGRLRHERGCALVDLNRCGTPLLEIVTAPALRSPEQARATMMALHEILRYCGVCEGLLEWGHLRCDANISLRPAGSRALGQRTEIKNLNSFRFVERALEAEIDRQRRLIASGRQVVGATLLWDPSASRTRITRSKETLPDYCYFPEPDLPDIEISRAQIEAARRHVPELPAARRRRFVDHYGLTPEHAARLAARRDLADCFEALARPDLTAGPRLRADAWSLAILLLNELPPSEPLPDLQRLREFLRLRSQERLSGQRARTLLREMLASGRSAGQIAARQGVHTVQDEVILQGWVDAALEAHPEKVAEYREGRAALLRFFMGQVMRRSRGQADPVTVRRLLRRALSGPRR